MMQVCLFMVIGLECPFDSKLVCVCVCVCLCVLVNVLECLTGWTQSDAEAWQMRKELLALRSSTEAAEDRRNLEVECTKQMSPHHLLSFFHVYSVYSDLRILSVILFGFATVHSPLHFPPTFVTRLVVCQHAFCFPNALLLLIPSCSLANHVPYTLMFSSAVPIRRVTKRKNLEHLELVA